LVAAPRLIHTMFPDTGRITHVAGQVHRSPGGFGKRCGRSRSL
jgi:hypothetical protein